MVWVKMKEKYHGKHFLIWKNKPSIQSARLEVKRWNRFDNPQEHLSIVNTSSTRPPNIVKTRYAGIYRPVKIARTSKPRRSPRRSSRVSSLFGGFDFKI